MFIKERSRLKDLLFFLFYAQNTSSKTEKIKVNKLFIKPILKHWESCTKLGNITLNVNLNKVPVDCIDYVIVHELCHLKYLNHSPKFYRLLEKYSPNWVAIRDRLNNY